MNTRLKKPVAWSWIPPLLWAGFIFTMSGRAHVPEPGFWLPPFADKIVHAGLYAILAGLLYYALRRSGIRSFQAAALAWMLASAYGITDEWHQSFVPGRTPDILDWLADTAGAATAFALARFEVRLRPALTPADDIQA